MLYAATPDAGDSPVRDAGWVRGGGGVRIRYTEGATFWISSGFDEVWVGYDPPLTGADAAYFLFEPVMAFLLRQRGTLALHASAVDVAGRAAVFCGSAGSGKSTTAGACVAAGHALLGDDVIAFSELGTRWLAHPGTATIRVWDDGARALGRDVALLPPVSPTWAKRTIDIAALGGRVAIGSVDVGLICVIGERSSALDAPRLEPLGGVAAVTALIAHASANYLCGASLNATALAQVARLAGTVPIVRLVASADPARLGDVVRLVGEHVGA